MEFDYNSQTTPHYYSAHESDDDSLDLQDPYYEDLDDIEERNMRNLQNLKHRKAEFDSDPEEHADYSIPNKGNSHPADQGKYRNPSESYSNPRRDEHYDPEYHDDYSIPMRSNETYSNPRSPEENDKYSNPNENILSSTSSFDQELQDYYHKHMDEVGLGNGLLLGRGKGERCGDATGATSQQPPMSPLSNGFPVPPRITENYGNTNFRHYQNRHNIDRNGNHSQISQNRDLAVSTYENVFNNNYPPEEDEIYLEDVGVPIVEVCALGHLHCALHEEHNYYAEQQRRRKLERENEKSATIFENQQFQTYRNYDSAKSTTASNYERELFMHKNHLTSEVDRRREIQFCNEFSATVAQEYLALYNFAGLRVDAALRRFLSNFALHGESSEREKVLMHFSRRYMSCNPSLFDSEVFHLADEVHTLVCALMLLNTDLHGPNVGKKMTCHQFIDNLGHMQFEYKRDLLKTLYTSIKEQPIEYVPDSASSVATTSAASGSGAASNANHATQAAYNSQLRRTGSIATTDGDIDAHVEYKKGWVMRKCDRLEQGKKAPFGRRGWRMFYATLKGLHLYLHKDDCGFKKGSYQTYRNGIRIHHAYAYSPNPKHYSKRQHVFAVRTADQSEYLFQTSGPTEVQSWIEMINFVAASFSSPPLPAPVGSNMQSGQFHKPLLPSGPTKLPMDLQITEHEHRVGEITAQLESLHADAPPRTAKGQRVMEFFQKERYLEEEKMRYAEYVTLLRSRLPKSSSQPPIAINGSVTCRPLGACAALAVNNASPNLLHEDRSLDVGFECSSSIANSSSIGGGPGGTDPRAMLPPHYADSTTNTEDSSQQHCASHQSDRLSYREAVDEYEMPDHHQSLQ